MFNYTLKTLFGKRFSKTRNFDIQYPINPSQYLVIVDKIGSNSPSQLEFTYTNPLNHKKFVFAIYIYSSENRQNQLSKQAEFIDIEDCSISWLKRCHEKSISMSRPIIQKYIKKIF